MSIVVTKSSPVLVGPSSTAPVAPVPEHVNLSSFDKAFAFFPVTAFHIFNNGIPKPAETIRRALSHALTHYFPIAGRFVTGGGDTGELRIACTGEGVAFVAATANCSLADVKLLDPPFDTLLRELSANRGAEGFREPDPPLLMQVTEFSCGGFVVGVTWNHGVADGEGFAQFMQAVGELARGLPLPSVFPVSFGDVSLPEQPPLVATVEKAMSAPELQDLAYLDITVPSSCINRIKAGFAGANAAGEPCTVFEAVVAVLWRCRTRVAMSDPKTPAPLIFAVSVRKQAGAKYGYYGNCVTAAVAAPTSEEVASGDINDVVKLIKRAKQEILRHFMNVGGGEDEGSGRRLAGVRVSSMEGPELLQGLSMEELGALFRYNAFVVSSWQNIGADGVDFGGGRPARVMCRMEIGVPNCVVCLPCEGKDGASVLAQCVKEEDVDAFLGEVSKFTQV